MINIWHGDSGTLTPLWVRRFISFRKLMNQLLLSNKSDPPAADRNVMVSVSCRHWLGFRRENLSFYMGTCGFHNNNNNNNRFITKDSYTWNITHNTESTAV